MLYREGMPGAVLFTGVSMVAYFVLGVKYENVMMWEGCTWSDDTFGQESQRLRGLEGRTRRILSHDASVEQRLPWVQGEPLVHLASVLAHESARVVGRRRHHRQHLARTRVDGDDTAYLAFEQSLAQGLQVDIKTQRQVLARDRSLVELTILVVALYSSSCITKHDFHTLLSTEHLLYINRSVPGRRCTRGYC